MEPPPRHPARAALERCASSQRTATPASPAPGHAPPCARPTRGWPSRCSRSGPAGGRRPAAAAGAGAGAAGRGGRPGPPSTRRRMRGGQGRCLGLWPGPCRYASQACPCQPGRAHVSPTHPPTRPPTHLARPSGDARHRDPAGRVTNLAAAGGRAALVAERPAPGGRRQGGRNAQQLHVQPAASPLRVARRPGGPPAAAHNSRPAVQRPQPSPERA